MEPINELVDLAHQLAARLAKCHRHERGSELKVVIEAVSLISDLRAELECGLTNERALGRFRTAYHGRLSRLLDPVRRGYIEGKRVTPRCIEFIDLWPGAETATLRYVAAIVSRNSIQADLRNIIDMLRLLVQELTPVT